MELKVKKKRRILWSRWVLAAILCAFVLLNIGMLSANAYLNSASYIATHFTKTLPDEVPPFVDLIGGEELTIAFGKTFEDPGVDAFDIEGDVEITTEGEVKTDAEGEYIIKYIVTDGAGNQTTVNRKVTVVRPTGTIYLTFDDGPGPYTAALLDVLAKYNVKATFFVTGRGDDDLIAREYKEGHTVALHTFSHDYSYVYSSVDNYFADLYAVQERVKNITGEAPTLIRFPGGSSNTVSARYDGGSHIMSTLVNEVASRGFTYFDWNLASGDAGGAYSTDAVYNRVVEGIKFDGDTVVLQHDIKDYSVDAVEGIIQYGLQHGFVFARLTKDSSTAHHGVNN